MGETPRFPVQNPDDRGNDVRAYLNFASGLKAIPGIASVTIKMLLHYEDQRTPVEEGEEIARYLRCILGQQMVLTNNLTECKNRLISLVRMTSRWGFRPELGAACTKASRHACQDILVDFGHNRFWWALVASNLCMFTVFRAAFAHIIGHGPLAFQKYLESDDDNLITPQLRELIEDKLEKASDIFVSVKYKLRGLGPSLTSTDNSDVALGIAVISQCFYDNINTLLRETHPSEPGGPVNIRPILQIGQASDKVRVYSSDTIPPRFVQQESFVDMNFARNQYMERRGVDYISQ